MPRRKTRYFPSYGRELPNASPDWIWQRAVDLVKAGRYATQQRDGPLVCRAAALYRANERGFSGRDDRKLYTSDPDLIEAESFENGPTLPALELKMRLLAGQGPMTVAANLGTTESFVNTFATFFFDLTDRLGAKTWVSRQVIGIQPGSPVSDEQLALRDAYLRGPYRIEPWLDFLMHRFEEHDLTTAIGRQREAIALQVIAANLPTDRETQKCCLERSQLWKKYAGKCSKRVRRATKSKKTSLRCSKKSDFRRLRVTRGKFHRVVLTERPTVILL
ncbi:hypothetical protein [Roseiconus lacunae]|uniref:hypothetical protein n=1 Tax=Roseiconus lacunae TaxID=2605694 RepID=UPI001E5E5AB1|nr:hypothetical protein [Roseiconus lacunae]MCD0458605.1 hypothetical protein [Roseiconus lacunae]